MDRLRPQRTSLVILGLLLVVAPALAGKGPLVGDPVRGKAVFSKNCVICHNADGSGGKRLTPNGNLSRDFRDPAFWASRTDDQIRKVINEGVPKSGMITWKGILKPQEIEDAMAYIKLFNKKPAEPAKP
jgi:cytochrome c oxidase cbb3-type subunit 3